MANALSVRESGRKVLLQQQRLIVGINIHHTIAQVSDFRPAVLKPRPYLPYLLSTLHKLQCDVHLITTLNPMSDALSLNTFLHQHVDIPHHLHFEVGNSSLSPYTTHHRQASSTSNLASGSGVVGRSRRLEEATAVSAPLTRQSFMPLLHQRAKELLSTPDQVLFVDAELNYRYSPVQTIVMEKFVHYTTRERRKAYKDYVGHEIDAVRKRRGLHTAADSGSPSPSEGTSKQEISEESVKSSNTRQNEFCNVPNSSDGTTSSPSPSTNRVGEEGLVMYHKPLPSSLLQDYTCVALATLIAEMSASPLTVKTFLQREMVLLEQLRVPMHGACYYLAIDNCEDLEMINWEEVEVEEQKAAERNRRDVGPTVKETDEHASFFQ